MASIATLMNLMTSSPDHTTVRRRAVVLAVIQPARMPRGPIPMLIDSTGLQVYEAGQCLKAKPGGQSRRKMPDV